MTDSALARKIDATAWSTVLLGVVCLGLAGLQAILPKLLDSLASSLDAEEDPTRAMREVWSAGAAGSAWVNAAFGIALVVIGVAVARRASWAHASLTIASWGSVAVLLALAQPTLAPFFAMSGAGESSQTSMLVVAAGLLVAQIVAVLWFLRFWRKPEVRAAFR